MPLPLEASLEDLLSSLPHHVLLLVLQHLDTVSLCSIARCSRLLHRLSAHPSLWPLVSYQSDWALAGIKLTMADILKLPPQVRRCLTIGSQHHTREMIVDSIKPNFSWSHCYIRKCWLIPRTRLCSTATNIDAHAIAAP